MKTYFESEKDDFNKDSSIKYIYLAKKKSRRGETHSAQTQIQISIPIPTQG